MKRSMLLGASVAPIAAPVAYAFFVMAFLPDHTPKLERTWETVAIALAVFLIPASYVVSLVFGVPLIYVLRRAGKLSFQWVAWLAVPLGAISLVSLFLIAMEFGATVRWSLVGWVDVASFLGSGALLGLVNGIAFCLLAGITLRSTRRCAAKPRSAG